MTDTKKRPQRALHRRHYRDDLLNQLLGQFAGDSHFREYLLEFARQHGQRRDDLRQILLYERHGYTANVDWRIVAEEAGQGETPAISEYVSTVRDCASATGLHYLPDDKGCIAIHEWFCRSLAVPDYPSEDFGLCLYTAMVPRVPPKPPKNTEWIVIDRGRPIAINVHFQGMWEWYSESPRRAKKLLRAEIGRMVDREIDNAAARVEQVDYIFTSDREKLPMHLHWLFQRIAYRWHVRKIAMQECTEDDGRDQIPEQYIRNTTDDLAEELGIIKMPRAEPNYTF